MDEAFFRALIAKRRIAADQAEAEQQQQREQAEAAWRDLGLRIVAGRPLLDADDEGEEGTIERPGEPTADDDTG